MSETREPMTLREQSNQAFAAEWEKLPVIEPGVLNANKALVHIWFNMGFRSGAEAQREKDAQVCESIGADDQAGWDYSPDKTLAKIREIAAAIRATGIEEK